MEPSKDPKAYDRLMAEAKAPYRFFRWFIYVALGSSGFIGAIVFLAQLVSGNDQVTSTLPNFFLQIGVVALMVWLFNIDRPKKGS